MNGIPKKGLTLSSLQKFSQGPTPELRTQISAGRKGLRKSGTTIVAIRYSDGVLMAGDRRMSNGYSHDDEAIKVHPISSFSLYGAAGTVSYIQELLESFRYTIETFERLVGKPIFIDGQAEIMKNILRENSKELAFLNLLLEYSSSPVLAGWNPENGSGNIFYFDESGGIYETGSVGAVAIGSGGDYARVVLEERWQIDMSFREAIWLAIRAIFRAAGIDLFTAPPQQHPVFICSASAKGLRVVGPTSALSIARSIEHEDVLRRKDGEKMIFHRKKGG